MKIFKFTCLAFFVFSLFSKQLSALEYSFVPLLKEHEKRGEEFYCAFQDSKGFLWFGTDMGIIRYDGHKKTYYTKHEGLPDNTVFGFYEDNSGRLWGRTFNGILFFIFNNKIYSSADLNKTLLENIRYIKPYNMYIPSSIYVDNFNIYLGYYEAPPLKITLFPRLKVEILPVKEQGVYVYDIDGNNFVFGTKVENTLHPFYINFSSPKENKVFSLKQTENMSHPRVIKIENNFLVLATNYVYLLNDEGIVFSQFFKENLVDAYYHNGFVYLAIGNVGVYKALLTSNGLTFKELIFKDYTPTVFVDKEENIWITTIEDGVYALPHYKFQKVPLKNSFTERQTVFIEKSNGKDLFFGLRNGEMGFYNNLSKQVSPFVLPFSTSRIYGCLFVPSNELWLSARIRFNLNYICILKDRKVAALIYDNIGAIKSMVYNPADSSVYVGQHDKLSVIKRNNKGAYQEKTLFFGRINSLILIENRLLYSTLHDLWQIDLKTKDFKPELLLSNTRINDMTMLSNNVIAASTHGLGLFIFDKDTSYTITTENGIISNIVNCVFFDEKRNNLWVGTPSGLSRIIFSPTENYDEYIVQNFNINAGLASNIVNDINIIGDTLFVAGKNGITVIPINNLPKKLPAPLIILQDVYVNYLPVEVLDFSGVLKQNERNIDFEFDVLSYSFLPNIILYYRLLPADSLWNKTASGTVSYKNLKYGSHTLQVKACTFDNYTCSEQFELNLFVQYPFWYKWWFHVFVLIFITFVVYIVSFFRSRNEKRKLKVKQMLLDAEKKALRAQMNPHFIFNALTSIQEFILTNNTERADYYIRQFAKLIRLILETSKKNKISLSNEVSIISLYLELEKLRMNNKFDYSIDVDKKLKTDCTQIPSMLIQPLIENSIWHGIARLKDRKGQINVSFEKYNDFVKCVIEDNGIGRISKEKDEAKNKFKSSMGFGITKKRVELSEKIGASIEIVDIKDESGMPIGTKVIMLI